jgi:PAS domain S-box-containing protein
MREKAAVVGGANQYCDLPGMKCPVMRWSLMLCVFVLAVSAHLCFAAGASAAKDVLILYSFTDLDAQGDLDILKSIMRSHVSTPIDFHVEYLGASHFDAPGYEKAVSESLASVYGSKGIDLVISTAWARCDKYVGVVLLMSLVQAMLIIGLLWQRSRNRKADLRLRESEQRFRLMADTTPALIWMCDRNGDVTYLNDRLIDFTGRDLATGFGDTWSAFIHPDDVESVQTANEQALKLQREFSKEYRLRRRDGAYRWMLDIAAPRVNRDGSFAGFVGSATDITDQKLAQEALEKIGGKLIEAQEEERSRIARELHDDICQRLALLSMELEQANRGSNSSSGSAKIEEIRRHCAQIAGDVQALSHKLHSSKLEYLGLAAAIRSFCREFSQQHDVSVQFADENVPRFLPRDISLSLFRVTQEALQNALKHSGVSQFSVSLWGSANEILLEVSDRGAGFDVEGAKPDRGLGLVSMQERVHLVHGIFTIESTENGGTKILVRVPLVAGMKASATVTEST